MKICPELNKKKRIVSVETLIKLKESHKGQIPWNKGKKGVQKAWNKGLKGIYSEVTLKKFKESHKRENLSLETLRKMSETQKKRSPETCRKMGKANGGKTTWNKGKKHTEETKRKIGEARMGMKCSEETKKKISEGMRGEKSYLWQGGKSFDIYPEEFSRALRRLIRIRDQNTCQGCGRSSNDVGYSMCVHHIDYDKTNCELSNLVCLCRSCHSKTNDNRIYWKNTIST